MVFDFSAFLVIAAVLTGVMWAVDSIFWLPKRRAALATYLERQGVSADARATKRLLREADYSAAFATAHEGKIVEAELRQRAKEPVLTEYARAFFPIIVVVLILRSFLVEPFRIPSGSMMPTLLEGDFILVNKFTYGLRLPVANLKMVTLDTPARGDVVVFRYPKDPSINYIKRVIGLPGDRVHYENKTVYINGQPMLQDPEGTYFASGQGMSMSGAERRKERLNTLQHDILITPGQPSMSVDVVVPAGHYFMMGDNRDNSNDSRFWGFVPEEYLVGKAFMIWFSWDSVNTRVNWSRMGEGIYQ